jgi:hypothetical protein
MMRVGVFWVRITLGERLKTGSLHGSWNGCSAFLESLRFVFFVKLRFGVKGQLCFILNDIYSFKEFCLIFILVSSAFAYRCLNL